MLDPLWILGMSVGGVSLAIGFPLWRLYRRTGVWAFVGSEDPVQRVVVTALRVAILIVLVYGGAWSFLGREAVGGWQPGAVMEVAGVACLCVGLVIVTLAQAQMGDSWRIGVDERPTALVTGGLFRWVRNPIYLGLGLLLTGLALVAPSPWSVMGGLWVFTVIAIQTRLEEAHLTQLHGEVYLDYARRVGRFLPGLGRL